MVERSLNVGGVLERMRQAKPLVHYLPNLVTAGFVADALLAFGAAPIMAIAMDEIDSIPAAAIALNPGTLTGSTLAVQEAAGRSGSARDLPVVIDPVGAGATNFRRNAALRLLGACPRAILRGNAGEIGALIGQETGAHGVDVRGTSNNSRLARGIAQRFAITAVVTGEIDGISDGLRTLTIANGHPLLARITGAGCILTGLVAACAAVELDYLLAAATAVAALGVAGEHAAERAAGPGTFRPALLDALYLLDGITLDEQARIAWI